MLYTKQVYKSRSCFNKLKETMHRNILSYCPAQKLFCLIYLHTYSKILLVQTRHSRQYLTQQLGAETGLVSMSLNKFVLAGDN